MPNNMDLFNVIYALVPFVVIYWLVGWEMTYYEKTIKRMKYFTWRAKLPMYANMILIAVAAILIAVPFIILAQLPHP